MKRGFVSLFILLGVVLLFAVLSMLFIAHHINTDMAVPEGTNAAQRLVDSCIEKLAADALRLIGQHGGMLQPRNALSTPFGDVAYYPQGSMIDQVRAQDEIASYIEDNIHTCLAEGFGAMQVDAGAVDVDVTFLRDTAIVECNMPMVAQGKGLMKEVSDFHVRVSTPILGLIERANDICNAEENFELARLGTADIFTFPEGRMLIVLTENTYKFAFATNWR